MKTTVAGQLENLAREIALIAALRAARSGEAEEADDVDELYAAYWSNDLGNVFFSGFFSLPPEVQAQAEVSAAAEEASQNYERQLSNERACATFIKKNWKKNTDALLGALRVFDGKKLQAFELRDAATIRKLKKKAKR